MKFFVYFFLLIYLPFNIQAQSGREFLSPVSSPKASVSQNVGMTNISIDYSSPGMKGRKIFGDLVPYDNLWRAGANSPTTISFSSEVKIGEKNIGPGTYAIAMIPRMNGQWTIDFNKAGKYPMAYRKDGQIDMDAYNKDLAHSITVNVTVWDNAIERLTYFIDANNNKVANINMLWSDVIVSFQVDTMADEHLKRFAKTLE